MDRSWSPRHSQPHDVCRALPCLLVKRDGFVQVVNPYGNVIERNLLLRLGLRLIVAAEGLVQVLVYADLCTGPTNRKSRWFFY